MVVDSTLTGSPSSPGLNDTVSIHPRADEIAVAVRHVSKMYPLYSQPSDRLKQSLWYALPAFLRGQPRQFYREFWALQDVSFEVKRGEALGIIGRNGSGKSTLLQIIAGTLAPTTGEVEVNGRVAALLELGSGFNPEFTGRENVYLNGAILGFSREEMDGLFDEIAAFADIGQFIDQPVKHYSSGMFVRLAFAVQACVEPEILIVDEALSVGDIFFRQKCYDRLDRLMKQNTAILLVTHSMTIIQEYCQYAVLLEKGETLYKGDPNEAVRQYFLLERGTKSTPKPTVQSVNELTGTVKHSAQPVEEDSPNFLDSDMLFWPQPEAFIFLSEELIIGGEHARCTAMALCDARGQACHAFEQGEWAYLYGEFEVSVDIEVPMTNVIIVNDRNVLIHGKSTLHNLWPDIPVQSLKKGERVRFRHAIKLDILVGEYTIALGFTTMSAADFMNAANMSLEEIVAKTTSLLNTGRQIAFIVTFRKNGGLTLLNHGICDLPSKCSVSVARST